MMDGPFHTSLPGDSPGNPDDDLDAPGFGGIPSAGA